MKHARLARRKEVSAMETRRVLFVSGSIGLGHAGRDVAIARALRARYPAVEISWLAGDPARQLIADAGETLVPYSVADDTASAEQIAGHFALNVAQYAWHARSAWNQNVATFSRSSTSTPSIWWWATRPMNWWGPSPSTRP
jgi:UDP:flavonoid glycosyltransferase YjiC (YdhE family)